MALSVSSDLDDLASRSCRAREVCITEPTVEVRHSCFSFLTWDVDLSSPRTLRRFRMDEAR